MTLRSAKERVIQTFLFELGGIALVSPAYAAATNTSMKGGIAAIALLSLVILIWAPIYNTLFDYLERERSGRLASDRSKRGRILHATLHEASSVMITCPLLIWLEGYSLKTTLFINISLTGAYVVYTYIFHLLYDRLRPVRCRTDFGCDLGIS